MPTASKVTTDHEEIRAWAEERGGRPAHVKSTGKEDDPGILRIDFPGYSGEGSLEEIEWDDWFDKFDERGLALLYQDTTAGGEKSNFNKIVRRETAEENEERSHRAPSRASASRGKRTSASSRVSKATRTSSDRSSRSREATRSRNQNRSEGRSSRKTTTGRSAQGVGRSSSRSRASASSRKESRSSGRTTSRSTGRKQVGSAGKSSGKRSASSRSNRRAA